MCCCGKPVVNGEMGYKWQPNDAPMVRRVDAPTVAEDETLIYDEPGRCGGIDSHSHHYRVITWHSMISLRVKHGGGEETVPLRLYGNGLREAIAAMDSNMRYWLLNELYHIHSDARRTGQQNESVKWRKAAANKQIKTRKQRGSNEIKVWIEDKKA